MKIMGKNISIVALILLVSTVLLIKGCGSNNEAKNEGCPKGSNLANSTDTITHTGVCGWSSYVYAGSSIAIYGERCVQDPMFTVWDSNGVPRNNVCIVFTTNGVWWTDHSYTTPLTGDQIIGTTNPNGTVTLPWTTYPLPLSSAATGTTAGVDYTYVPAAISAVSGAVVDMVSADIAVKGCLAGSAGLCP